MAGNVQGFSKPQTGTTKSHDENNTEFKQRLETAAKTHAPRTQSKKPRSQELLDLRKELDKILDGRDKRLTQYLKGEITAFEAGSSRHTLRAVFDQFVERSQKEDPSALSEFYRDYEQQFSRIAKASTTSLGEGYKVDKLEGSLKAYADGRIGDDGLQLGIYSSRRRPTANGFGSAYGRLSAVSSRHNIDWLKKSGDPHKKLTSESEMAFMNVRVGKAGTLDVSTNIRVYRYPNGDGQIEFESYVKGAVGKAVEVNISETYKEIKPKHSNDETHLFAEWIAGAGAEGAYNSKYNIPSVGGVSGWRRARNLLDKLKSEQPQSRFLPWEFFKATKKEFGSQETGSTTSAGVTATTKLYGSAALLKVDDSRIPAALRPTADSFRKSVENQTIRGYGEVNLGIGINFIHNYNDPNASVFTEHTDTDNVQTVNYYGVKFKGEAGAKGVFSAAGHPAGIGGSLRSSYSIGTSDHFDTQVWTTDLELRSYNPRTFFDGRVNRGKDPRLGKSIQTTIDHGGERILKLRERQITSTSSAKDLAYHVSKRTIDNMKISEKLRVLDEHLPGGGDLSYKGEAYNKLQDKLGQSLTADEWEKFLELQMDGARGNNLDSLQPSGRPAVKDWKKNRKKAQQQIVQEWRSTNKINQLEKTYQTHWPTVRERLVAEDRNKIETMDTAEVSAYLGEKRVLTPGTTTFTIMEGAAEKKQFSVGESFPNKPGENRRSKGLMKTILAITEEQHVRQGTFTIAENNRELAHRILRSEDTNLKRAFLDIYNAQTYPTSDKYGERIYLKPIYSGDPRHINHIIQQSGISPAYGKSVYRVSKADIKPDETVQVTMGRIYRNGLSQLSGNNLLPVETDLNSADFEKRFDSLVNHFTKINFPGASDQEVRERLEEGVPLMLITP